MIPDRHGNVEEGGWDLSYERGWNVGTPERLSGSEYDASLSLFSRPCMNMHVKVDVSCTATLSESNVPPQCIISPQFIYETAQTARHTVHSPAFSIQTMQILSISASNLRSVAVLRCHVVAGSMQWEDWTRREEDCYQTRPRWLR